MTTFLLRRALLDAGLARDVRVCVDDVGVISELHIDVVEQVDDIVLEGLALPGFANAHSHAFHRMLRGRTHGDRGTFWTWRALMYDAAARLSPERYYTLARAFFAECLEAGYTALGEFHYLHRRPDGAAYAPSTAMAEAIVAAASHTGLRLTLLHTAYLRSGLDDGQRGSASAAHRRFVDDIDSWTARHQELDAFTSSRLRRGAALHSLRGVDPTSIPDILAAIEPDEPLHAHVSEQPAENEQVKAAYQRTPVAVLNDVGALSPRFTAVHATHLTDLDVELLAASGAGVCLCPSTERDLADGIGPGRALASARVPLSIGSDQHVVVDPFDELRQLEGHERLATGRRGHFDPAQLLQFGTRGGYQALGWQGGSLTVGALADFVVIDDQSSRTAGAVAEHAWLSATASDVRHTIVGGSVVVRDGVHHRGSSAQALHEAIEEVWS